MKKNIFKTSALACVIAAGLVSTPLIASGATAPLTPAEYAVLENDDRRLTDATINGDSLNMQVTSPRGYNETVSVNIGDADSVSSNTSRSISNRTDISTNTTAISQLNQHYLDTAADHQRQIDQVTSDMRYLDRNLSAGIASAMAIGQHQFDPTYTGGQVSLSGGVFNGQNAVSFAVGVPLGNRAFFSAAIATDSGQYGESGSVGVSLRLPK